ncbi:PEP-CTERM sorting domain-containing protein [Paucibacter sp. AS339]|uniref:PEP-CTERM sorting domain-containing protein n=1 Tax=Paucibacter hankyongi TaxID=3133434 RepID=UPI0030A42A66
MSFRLNPLSSLVAAALVAMASQASAQVFNGTLTQGVSSSQSSYVQGATGYNITSIITAGDAVGGYRMSGLPDGLGAFDNGNGTFTVLMNHEIGANAGIARAHGGTGAFVSSWVIDKNTLAVQSGGDLIKKVYGWDAATQSTGALVTGAANLNFQRFCSADLAATSAYSYNGYGTTNRIFLNGEEVGTSANSRAMAHVATGANAGSSFVLGAFNLATNGSGQNLYSAYENLAANPFAQMKTVVIGQNDGGTGISSNAVAVYVGTKTNVGSDVDRAGLTNGVMKYVNVVGNTAEIADAATRATNIANGSRFTLSATASTTFSRPEDGAWDTRAGKQNVYYFVTTDRVDTTELNGGTQVGATRLWSMTFDDIANPDAGGKIDLLVDGSKMTGGLNNSRANMFDNMTVNKDGTITMQEDTGNNDHNGKIWEYNLNTGAMKIVAKSDAARFGDVVNGVFTGPGSNKSTPTVAGYHTYDEETSGIIDVTDIFDAAGTTGKKYQLFVTQDHASAAGLDAAGMLVGNNPAGIVEGGQLQLMVSDAVAAVPEPQTYALMLAGLGLVGFAARRKAAR